MTLRLLARRAAVQLPLLSAVVAMVTVGATLLGVCALLLTVSQDRALDVGLHRVEPDDVSVTAYVIDVGGPHTASVAADTRAAMASALAPFPVSSTDTRASSVTRPLADRSGATRQVAYFSSFDRLQNRTQLVKGRFPRAGGTGTKTARFESVVLETTARRLGLTVGDRVRFGRENSSTDPGPAMAVDVVGIVQPVADAGWDRDPLRGAGYDPAFTSAQYVHESAAYGPFILDGADLWASRSTMDRLQVTVQPDLKNPTGARLDAAATSLGGVDPRLKVVLGDRVGNERVASALPATLSQARFQQNVTRSTVLVVVLLGTALTAAALGLAGRLMVALRSSETALFSAMGAGRGQLVAQAAGEALGLAVLSTVLAVPLSSLAYTALTHLPRLVTAGLDAPLTVTATQVLTVLGGALLLATMLVVPALRPDPARLTGSRGRLSLLGRTGGDLLLLLLAGAGWWQLRAQPASASGTDAVRVVAPVLCLVAGAALAPRVVAVPLRLAERLARNSRGLVLPLAMFEAARGPRAVAAALLLALAAAAGTFGLALGSTWERSQQEQADVRVGTDLTVNLRSPVRSGQAARVADATGGSISPVTSRNIIIGRWIGDADTSPRLIAVDSRKAGSILRGRLPDGQDWGEVGAAMAPKDPDPGVALDTSEKTPITLTAGVTASESDSVPGDSDGLQLVPRLVLQDEQGLRTPCTAPAVPMDGRAHELRLCDPPTEGTRVVAMALSVVLDPTVAASKMQGLAERAKQNLSIAMTLPAAAGTPAGTQDWRSWSQGQAPLPIPSAISTATTTGGRTVLKIKAVADVAQLGQYGIPSLDVVVTPFWAPTAIPAVVSQRLADQLQVAVGGELSLALGGTSVPVTVARIVPTVPSAPGEVAVMIDSDLLSRSLIVREDLDSPVDAWWVGDPTPAAKARAQALNLGPVVTRTGFAAQLSSGPLRVGVPAALLVLVPAVILLVLAGTIMHVTSDVDARAVEIARLRGLGLSRRSILGGLLAQHGGVLALLLGCGAVVGVLTSFVVAPLLVRSEFGAAPVPSAVATWPWSTETGLLAVLLLGSISAVAVVVNIQLRRADAAYLRVGA